MECWNKREGEVDSIVTIYKNAVCQVRDRNFLAGKRVSSSSEQGDGFNTSDEIDKLEVDNLTVQTRNVNDKVLQFISENRPAAQTSQRLTDERRRYIVNTTRYVDREVPKIMSRIYISKHNCSRR